MTQDHLIKLVVEDDHRRTSHSGTRATFKHLRTQFGLPRGKIFTKKTLKKCNTCRCRDCKSYKYPDNQRYQAIASTRHHSSMLSELTIQDTSFSKEHHRVIYIAVWACCITRAVHLTDPSAEQFLLSFRRFCARRSVNNCIG